MPEIDKDSPSVGISAWISEYNRKLRLDPLRNEKGIIKRAMDEKNELVYWYRHANSWGFRTPRTKAIMLPPELLGWLLTDTYDEYAEKRERCLDYIAAVWDLIGDELDMDGRLFVKSGTCAGKFSFNESCIAQGRDSIARCMFSTNLEAMELDKPLSPYFVFREFIETDPSRDSIYGGLKLNTEFRVFYDFDRKKLLRCFNYWGDTDNMLRMLHGDEKAGYLHSIVEEEKEYARLAPELEMLVQQRLKDAVLEGSWSVDFMWTGSEFVLIDMATACQSYFADKVPELWGKE